MPVSFMTMSTVQEIEAAIPRPSQAELEQLRARFEHYRQDQLEPIDDVKAKLDESLRGIAAGGYMTRQPVSTRREISERNRAAPQRSGH